MDPKRFFLLWNIFVSDHAGKTATRHYFKRNLCLSPFANSRYKTACGGVLKESVFHDPIPTNRQDLTEKYRTCTVQHTKWHYWEDV